MFHGSEKGGRARNWAFLIGLGICSLAVAGLGIFGWVFSRAPAPLIACAAAFCVAAQFVAACCGANFGRHTWRAAWGTRLLLVAGYLAAATFAAYSADQGWMRASSTSHIEEAAQRANERGRIEAEIAEREAYVQLAEDQRARVRAPGPLLTAQLQAPYDESIARHEARLRELRADLEAKPPLPLERARNAFDWIALFAFIFWQALEPWLYGAVERGRRPTAAVEPSTDDNSPSTASLLNFANPVELSVEVTGSTVGMLTEAFLRDEAKRLRACGWSQERIAAKLTEVAGTEITRHRVRCFLGLYNPAKVNKPEPSKPVLVEKAA